MNAANPLHLPAPPRQLDRAVRQVADQPADRQAEPSMEEILASIRRIIADDQGLAQQAAELVPTTPPFRAPRERPAVAADDEAPRLAAYGQVTAPQFPSPEGPSGEEEDALSGGTDAAEPSLDAHGDEALGDDAHAGDAQADQAHPDYSHADHSRGPARAGAAAAPTPSPQQDKRMRDPLARDVHEREAEQRGAHPRDLPAEATAHPSSLFSQATDASLSSAFNMLAATRLADDSQELRAMAREMIKPLLKDWLDDNLPTLVERLVRAEIERVSRGGR